MATVHAWRETERSRQQQQREAKQGVPNRTVTELGGIHYYMCRRGNFAGQMCGFGMETT